MGSNSHSQNKSPTEKKTYVIELLPQGQKRREEKKLFNGSHETNKKTEKGKSREKKEKLMELRKFSQNLKPKIKRSHCAKYLHWN